tara:strand:- start:188 stop:430 length:243 start_codon:yes stop_codon:yes gene_type:complete
MDWKNVNLESNYEKSKNLLENYTFEDLLLEIYCNFKEEEIEHISIFEYAKSVFKMKYNEAIEILNLNLNNITNHAKKERK